MPKRKHSRKKSKRGMPVVNMRDIPLDRAEAAIRLSGGFLSKAAQTLGVPLQMMQLMVKKYSTLREVLVEARYSIVDKAEESLIELIEANNVTATIFALKCLGKERGYVELPKPGSSPDAPLHIRLMPVTTPRGTLSVKKADNDKGDFSSAAKEEIIEGEVLPALEPKIMRRKLRTKEEKIVDLAEKELKSEGFDQNTV